MTKAIPCSCILCGKLTSNLGITPHFRIVHEQKKEFQLAGNKARRGQPGWNKNKPLSEAHRAKISKSNSGKHHTEETKLKISQNKNGLMGGFRIGGGKGKKGYFQGVWCDSSWELAFLIYHLDEGNSITRVREPRVYTFNGKQKKYYPDFLVNGVTYEIKGWRTPQWEAKAQQHPDVVVFDYECIKPILEIVKFKYGNDFTKLYE